MICDQIDHHGTPESVADQLLASRTRLANSARYCMAGKDWKDRELGSQSMIWMAEKVMPRINAAFEAIHRAE